MQSSPPTLALALLTLLLALAVHRLLPSRRPYSLLRDLSAHQFAWGASTTAVPISAVSVLAKRLLARDTTLPEALRRAVPPADTIPIQPVRDFLNAQRLERIATLCSKRGVCDVNERDAVYGLTPLHLAAAAGDEQLAAFLRHKGAVEREDAVGRRPRKLTYGQFVENSKRFARQAGRADCDFPVVQYDASERARRETRRLVMEGEPVLLKGALRRHMPGLEGWSAEALVGVHGHMEVTVGRVPYAAAFNLTTQRMRLRDFYNECVVGGAGGELYVFSKGSAVCGEGYAGLVRLLEEAFPVGELLEHPRETGGVGGAHFFFGKRGSGAPFHIHADAVNGAVRGRKKWFVFTPARTVYSRKAVKEWVEEEYAGGGLECVQEEGDVVYVPLDWGHAVLNLDEETFGVALEVLNKRDTLSHLWR